MANPWPAPIAHISPARGRTHDLAEHLRATSALAGRFAQVWDARVAASLAALWHDLGKYAPDFQAKLAAVGEDGHLETPGRPVIHAHAGADHALKHLPVPMGPLLAMVIAGHHAGLPDWDGGTLKAALAGRSAKALAQKPPSDLLAVPSVPTPAEGVDLGLWARMIASAVYDADFLNTELFFRPDEAGNRDGWPAFQDLPARFETGLAAKLGRAAPCPVDEIRNEVLAACRAKATDPTVPPGLFSLRVPTGGGKTLSSLAFALAHAQAHGLRRVIYALPFTSIVDQTASVFREVLGKDAVLEHHSALAPDERSARTRLASENWDAPVVVTTTVQLFESLFASRPSRLRKLHNLAGSVLVLDEAQALPPHHLRPMVAVIDQLARHFKVSVVLCTATQPALSAVFPDLPDPVEIGPDPPRLFSRLDRVRTSLPAPGQTMAWAAVAGRMADVPQALAIVNTRADCRALYQLLPPGSVHLSNRQCAAHRRRLLADVQRRLAAGEAVRVASTSLIEAGVDISFPVVLRAMAGLDSLAQAAGRCNRHALVDKGEFVVFRPAESRGRPDLPQAIAAAETVLAANGGNPFPPEAFTDYFEELIWLRGAEALDEGGIMNLLRLPLPRDAGQRVGEPYKLSFRTAAERFRMVQDDFQTSLVVPYGDEGLAAIEAWRAGQGDRRALRNLQPFCVQLGRSEIPDGATEMVHGVEILAQPELYGDDIGFS